MKTEKTIGEMISEMEKDLEGMRQTNILMSKIKFFVNLASPKNKKKVLEKILRESGLEEYISHLK